MNLKAVLKLYNFKQLKKEKWLLSFTALSIFIAVLVSLMVPQISESHKRYMDENIRALNGGDLNINVKYPSKAFNEELKKIIDEGYEVKSMDVNTGFFISESGKKTVGSVLNQSKIYNKKSDATDYNIKEDEVVLYSNIVKTLNLKVGDKLYINDTINGKKEYKLKAIENLASGVDADAEILGYGKIIKSNSSINNDSGLITKSGIVIINGKEYGNMKERLKNIEDGYFYTTVDDKKSSVKSQIDVEVSVLSIVTSLAYILSALGIISTTIMLLIKRKRDIAILRMLNISSKTVKRAMAIELGLIIGIPLILATISSFYFSTLFLKINKIIDICTLSEKLPIVIKGFLFNGIMFLVILKVALLCLNSIKPLSVIREDEVALKKSIKKSAILISLLIPVMLFLYAVFIGKISSAIASIGVIIFIFVFFILVLITLKLLQLVPFRNPLWIYSIKTIKKNFSSFILVVLSITLTLIFILIGFNMEKTVKDSFNKSVSETLPYDHMVASQQGENVDDIFKTDINIVGYSKLYSYGGKLLNKDIKFRMAYVDEIKEEEYGTKFKIIEGDDLFQGEKDGGLVSKEFICTNDLKLGDTLNLETEQGNIDIKIKGIYEGGKIDSQKIITPFNGKGKNISYIVKGKNDEWTNKIKDSYVISMGVVGESFGAMVSKFLTLFKGLCFISIFSSLLFNINMGFMNYMNEERDETIIRALGIGRKFNIKHEVLKLSIVVLISCLMSIVVYNLATTSMFKAFMDASSKISIKTVIVTILIGVLLSVTSFYFPINKLRRNISYDILREE